MCLHGGLRTADSVLVITNDVGDASNEVVFDDCASIALSCRVGTVSKM
jgi:hypothetical protein